MSRTLTPPKGLGTSRALSCRLRVGPSGRDWLAEQGVGRLSSERMERASEAAISLTEAAYDLQVDTDDWLPRVMQAGLPLIDHGLGVAGLIGTRPPTPGPVHLEQMHVASGPPDFPMRMMRAMAELPPETMYQQATSGIRLLSELTAEDPEFLEAWTNHIDYAKDCVGVTALDPDGRGVHLAAPVAANLRLSRTERARWRMVAAHLCAGLRLRKAVKVKGWEASSLPCGAEAILDPKSFNLEEAVGDAQRPDTVERLRQAAIQVDRARGRLRQSDPEEALHIWKALVRGRWSIVSWFDSDQRRYVLAVPNPPNVLDPRGLTKRESQVAAYAAMGESHKAIAYRLGISPSRVSDALASTMRKLRVKTQPQLVERLRTLQIGQPDGSVIEG